MNKIAEAWIQVEGIIEPWHARSMPFLAFMPKTMHWKEQKCHPSVCVVLWLPVIYSRGKGGNWCAVLQDNLGYYDKHSCGKSPTAGGVGLGRLPLSTLSPSPIWLKSELDCCDRILIPQLMIWRLFPSYLPVPSQTLIRSTGIMLQNSFFSGMIQHRDKLTSKCKSIQFGTGTIWH